MSWRMRYGKSWGQLGMKYKLSEVMDVIGGGTPKTSKPEYWNGDIPWLSVKDFNNDYRYVYRTEKSITKEGLENSTTKLLDKGDMIISARGTVGEVASVPYPMQQYKECHSRYINELNISPAFYSVVYEALQKACFMEVAKLYDKTRDAFSIGDFLETCKNNEKIFLECKEFIEYTCDGQDYKDEVPYEGMFQKERLLDLLKNFILFSGSGSGRFKVLAGYHQYFAVRKAIEKAKVATKTDGKGGVFWHTQGSGKSLSMVFYAHLLQEALDSPTIVVMTDRIDLDDQLYTQFSQCADFLRQTPVQAESKEHLKSLLDGRSANGIIFTTMFKFERGEKPLSERRNIVVMADDERVIIRTKLEKPSKIKGLALI